MRHDPERRRLRSGIQEAQVHSEESVLGSQGGSLRNAVDLSNPRQWRAVSGPYSTAACSPGGPAWQQKQPREQWDRHAEAHALATQSASAESTNQAPAAELVEATRLRKQLHAQEARVALAASEAGRLAAENATLRVLLQDHAGHGRVWPLQAASVGPAAASSRPGAGDDGWGRAECSNALGSPAGRVHPLHDCTAKLELQVGERSVPNDGLVPGARFESTGAEALSAELAAAADLAALTLQGQERGSSPDSSCSNGGDSSNDYSRREASTSSCGKGCQHKATDNSAAGCGWRALQDEVQQLGISGGDGKPQWDGSTAPASWQVHSDKSAKHRCSYSCSSAGLPLEAGTATAGRGPTRQQRPPNVATMRGVAPAACSWVPAEALSCIEEFYSQHGLAGSVPWVHLESLLARLDRAFGEREASRLVQQRERFERQVEAIRRRCNASRNMPQVVAEEKISRLQRQLAEARRVMAARDDSKQKALLQVWRGGCMTQAACAGQRWSPACEGPNT
jgi:hypothetical protein